MLVVFGRVSSSMCPSGRQRPAEKIDSDGRVLGHCSVMHRTARRDDLGRTNRGPMTKLKVTKHFGGEDFACVLGQDMAGYATGEVFFLLTI